MNHEEYQRRFYSYKAKMTEMFDLSGNTAWLEVYLVLNGKMRSTAGKARLKLLRVELNKRLLDENESHIDTTIVHELAHMVCALSSKYKDRGHGRMWRYIMLKMGFKADRCHTLDTSNYKRTHAVVAHAFCGCRADIPLKAKRVSRIKNGTIYRCRSCKTRVKLKA